MKTYNENSRIIFTKINNKCIYKGLENEVEFNEKTDVRVELKWLCYEEEWMNALMNHLSTQK